MRTVRSLDFAGTRAWDALPVGRVDDVTVTLHWTDQPYRWHVNDGAEVFVVLDGVVDMYMRDEAGETISRLNVGDIFCAEPGDEHVAHPIGAARILVIERAGSV